MNILLNPRADSLALILILLTFLGCKTTEEGSMKPESFAAHAGVDIDTDAYIIGTNVIFPTFHPNCKGEAGIDLGTGNQDFGDFSTFESFGKTTRLAESQSYTVIQPYAFIRYPISRGENSKVEISPLGGLRYYHFRYNDCEGEFCSESEIALNLGVGFNRGPLGLDVFTGIGDVPDFSLRLKYTFKKNQ